MSSRTSTEQLSTGNFTESLGYEGNHTPTATPPSIQSSSQGHVMVKFSCLLRPFVQSRSSTSTQHHLDSNLTSPITFPTHGSLPGSEESALLFSLTLMKLDLEFFDSMSTAFDDWRSCLRDSFAMLRRTRLPTGASLHISIVALLMHLLHRQCFLPLLQISSTKNPMLGNPPDSSLVLLYFLPMVVTVVSLAISVTLLLQLHPVDASVVSGLVALLVMECLVPVTVAACTGLFFAQAMTWDSALLLLVSVWIASTVSARCIRVSLYPSLGHGT